MSSSAAKDESVRSARLAVASSASHFIRTDVDFGMETELGGDRGVLRWPAMHLQRHLLTEAIGAMTRPQRLLWIVNHRTLLQAEVPIFRSLGYEVFIPKIIPVDGPDYRSAIVTFDYDSTLSLSQATMTVLNTHDFYQRAWSPTVASIVNEQFDVVVCTLSVYLTPLSESTRKFGRTVIARVFGLEDPRRYSDYFRDSQGPQILQSIRGMGERFVFGQGYANLADVEGPEFRRRACTIAVPLPPHVYDCDNTWVGDADRAILLCPGILPTGYYRQAYEAIKRDFGDLPHAIFGRQSESVDDPAILPYLSDDDLLTLYASAPVFIYPSTEPRHVHYSPVEAMVIGTPVLYRRGALIDTIAGAKLPGACSDTNEMRAKAQGLLSGDRSLAEAIRAGQRRVVEAFSIDVAARQWAEVLRPERGGE